MDLTIEAGVLSYHWSSARGVNVRAEIRLLGETVGHLSSVDSVEMASTLIRTSLAYLLDAYSARNLGDSVVTCMFENAHIDAQFHEDIFFYLREIVHEIGDRRCLNV